MSGVKSPLRFEARGDAWWVYFDTPRTPVNIFTAGMAEAVLELCEKARREGPRALVFGSAKAKSFINGAQLMMASALRTCDDVFPLTDLLRQAYRAVHELDMLTVAAVQGTCYGCGVEFTLNCDHRIVADSGHTQFYMTELVDYLNTPAFGSTQRLVGLMPLPEAVDFLMWGKRLRAAEAVSSGLASARVPWQDFEGRTATLVDAMVDDRFERPSPGWLEEDELESFVARVWGLIEALPADYRQIHRDCFQLMLHGRTKSTVDREDETLELLSCGRSLVTPVAQRARSILYVRQLAERVCLRRGPPPEELVFVIDEAEAELAGLRQSLVAQNHPRSRVVDRGEEARVVETSFLFKPSSWFEDGRFEERPEAERPVAYSEGVSGGRPISGSGPVMSLRRPAPGLKDWSETKARPRGGATMLVELVAPAGGDEGRDLLFDYLTEFDAAVICSRPQNHFACDVMAMAYLAPMAALIARGGSVQEIREALHDFGFLQMPWELRAFVEPSVDLVRGLARSAPSSIEGEGLRRGLEVLMGGEDRLVQRRSVQPGGEPEHLVVEAMLLSLLGAQGELLSEGVLAHPSLVDVIALELLGFPIPRGTLGQYLTRERVGRVMAHRAQLEELVSSRVLHYAEAFYRNGRDHYV